jgi:hypothetical protein
VGEQRQPISFGARPAAAIVEEVSMPVKKRKPGKAATKSKSKLKSGMKKKKAGKKKKK